MACIPGQRLPLSQQYYGDRSGGDPMHRLRGVCKHGMVRFALVSLLLLVLQGVVFSLPVPYRDQPLARFVLVFLSGGHALGPHP